METNGQAAPPVEGELTALRAQLATTEEALRDSKYLVSRIFEMIPDIVSIYDLATGKQIYANRELGQVLGYSLEQLKEMGDQLMLRIVHPDDLRAAVALQQRLTQIGDDDIVVSEQRVRHADGTWRWLLYRSRVFSRDEAGRVQQIIGTARDISEEKQAAIERAELHEQVIKAQQAVLRELSTPLIPLSDGLVVLPLVGSVDSGRAQQILESLLEGVSSEHATIAIIDITGVPVVDTQVANTLLRAAQAVRLLGAQVILTGIRPEVAQTLVNLGADLTTVVTRATLQSGIAFALQQSTASRS